MHHNGNVTGLALTNTAAMVHSAHDSIHQRASTTASWRGMLMRTRMLYERADGAAINACREQ
jgi:hypothetical protein